MDNLEVFPAQAGVFLLLITSSSSDYSIPRPGGGVSGMVPLPGTAQGYSPPRRGCFLRRSLLWLGKKVFPAQAGVFLDFIEDGESTASIPRPGGGVSRSQ
jgi:hypothetical protein